MIPLSDDNSTIARRSSGPTPNPGGHPDGANASSTGSSKRLLTEPFPVGQRLRQVLDLDVSRSREICHGPGDLQRAVESSPGERERVHRRRQEMLGVGGQVGVTPDERSGQVCVARDADPRVPNTLSFARRSHTEADDIAPLTSLRPQQLLLGETWNPQAEVDAVEQWSGQFVLVQLHAVCATTTVPPLVAVEPARTGSPPRPA